VYTVTELGSFNQPAQTTSGADTDPECLDLDPFLEPDFRRIQGGSVKVTLQSADSRTPHVRRLSGDMKN